MAEQRRSTLAEPTAGRHNGEPPLATEVQRAIAEDDAPIWNPADDDGDGLPAPPEPDSLVRRTEDGAEMFGAADNDQRMR